MTTFARIAKILKGLVEPRNWVEEAFSDIEVEENKFHIKITGEGTPSGDYLLYRVTGDAADSIFNTISNCNAGDKGIVEIGDLDANIFPAVVDPRLGSRISVSSAIPVYRGLDGGGNLIYMTMKGNTSSNSGAFYVYEYRITPYSE